MAKSVIKLPDSKGGWASLILGIGLTFVGVADWMMGNYEQAWTDWAGALGTLGLPALFGKGYHLEIKQDVPVDTSPPKGFEGMRIGGPDDDTDDLVPKRVRVLDGATGKMVDVDTRTGKPVAEVRRADEI